VLVNAGTVTIHEAGTYLIAGTLSNGQIVVDAAKTAKIRLIFNNVTIHNPTSAPIYIKQADKVFITLADDSINLLSNDGAFVQTDDNTLDAVIYSQDDLTINGIGSLELSSDFGHGIVSKDDLVITGGSYQIDTSGHGLSGKDSLRIADGSFVIHAGEDGLHSANADNLTLGYVYIAGGRFTITAGDDGIHADRNVTINGGKIDILQSYEGIEGESIDIKNGAISLLATDDGFNAANGSTPENEKPPEGTQRPMDAGKPTGNQPGASADETCYVKISGGTLYINATGDGIDSNGSISISGGETYISGPSDNGNTALDYNGSAEITAGLFVAAGSAGMAQNFTSATQGALLITAQTAQTGEIILANSNNNTLAFFSPEKEYRSVLISTPDMRAGETYSVTVGSETQTITLSSLIYGDGGHKGGEPPNAKIKSGE
ncbi:MAG: carbohydrate-binding domain-containing protein, partial [Evtepia sp.]